MIAGLPSVGFVEAIFAFIFGACFGSFGNVLIYRLPAGEKITGRSHCQHTGKTLAWWELIPILSFVILRGKSRYSKKPLSWQYPLIELASGLLFVFVFMQLPYFFYQKVLLALIFWLLLLVSVIDARTRTIPDALNIPFVILSGIFALTADQFSWLTLLIGVGFLGIQWLLSGGRWIGSGDVILIAGMSLLLGAWQRLLLCALFSYVIGAVVATGLIVAGKASRKDPIAFGPFLATGTFITFVWGNRLLFHFYGVILPQ